MPNALTQWWHRLTRRDTSGQALVRIGKDLQLNDTDMALLRRDLVKFLEAKSITPQQLIHTWSASASWSDYDETEAIDEGVLANVWVYRCTTVKATSASTVPFRVWRRTGPATRVPEDGPAQALIDQPNDEWSWASFVMHASYHGDLSGESYWTKIRPERSGQPSAWRRAKGKKAPNALWAYAADKFAPVREKGDSRFVSYYRSSKRELGRVDPEDMIHFKRPRPGDPWHGMSPFQAALKDIQTDTSAATFQKHSLDNRMVPDGMIIVHGAVGGEKFNAIREKFEARYAGAANARKPVFLPGAGAPDAQGRVHPGTIEWVDLAKSARDLDFMEGRKLSRENICAAFGVPPMLVGIMDQAALNNFKVSELVFWKLTVLPQLEAMRQELENKLLPEFGDDLELSMDLSGVDALYLLWDERRKSAQELVDRGVPWSVASGLCRLDMPPFPGWDVAWIDPGKVPVDVLLRGGFAGGGSDSGEDT